MEIRDFAESGKEYCEVCGLLPHKIRKTASVNQYNVAEIYDFSGNRQYVPAQEHFIPGGDIVHTDFYLCDGEKYYTDETKGTINKIVSGEVVYTLSYLENMA